jgi:hypothetical protein
MESTLYMGGASSRVLVSPVFVQVSRVGQRTDGSVEA